MSGARVLLAVNDFPPLLGGESTLYHGLARHLPASSTVVLAPRQPGDAGIDRELPLEVVRRTLPAHGGALSRIVRGVMAAGHLAALLKPGRFNYLVCGQLLSLGGPMRLLARMRGVPYAVFIHGADLLDYHDRPPWGRMARWVVQGADAVVTNSQFTAALVQRLLPGAARRIIVLPMGVDRAAEPAPGQVAALRERYGLGDGPILVSVARLVPCKGHDVVIQALPVLASRFPALRYMVVGEGPHRDRLEALAARLGVGTRVVFCGRVAGAELPAHFRLGTVFVQLSRVTRGDDGLEGFGLSFLEAASHGLPVIGGDSGGVAEALRHEVNGLLVPPEDVAAFTRAAARLLDDPAERQRMSAAGVAWAAGHSWDRTAAALGALWDREQNNDVMGSGAASAIS